MQLKKYKIAELKEYPGNYNQHPEAQLIELEKSLNDFGQFKNIVVWNNQVIAGNGLVMAAKRKGLEEIHAIDKSDLTEQQAKALLIADNATPALGVPDIGKLEDLLEGIDFDIPGVNDDFLSEMGIDLSIEADENENDPDVIPEDVAPTCKAGQLWQLGEHRLLCGDCTDKEQVEMLMDGEKADLLLTDPPYGINCDKGFGGAVGFNGKTAPIRRREYKDVWDSERPDKDCFDLILSQADNVIIFGGNFFADILPQGNFWLVWDKHNTMPTFGDCELAWTNIKRDSVKKIDLAYNGLIGKEKERFHPTQKPVELFRLILEDYTEQSQTILDPFGGSGTTLIACEKTNRKCRMMEISEKYCDVIITRWEEYSGGKAELIQ